MMMTLLEAINARHSVRRYANIPIDTEAIEILRKKVDECNQAGQLHIQLITNEPKAFSGLMAYGTFQNVKSYIVMAGLQAPDLDERVGYYGEQLVLLAQQLGLGTCWAGISYRKVKGTYTLNPGEKIACMIALGVPNDKGRNLKRKTPAQVTKVNGDAPEWFLRGVEAALKAPTAINQQKFRLEYLGMDKNGKAQVRACRLFSPVGYTQMDLGIVKLHFEIGAGRENFEWKK